MKKAIFHLGPKGIIENPDELLRMLFLHGWCSSHGQTQPIDEIFSFQYIASIHGANPAQMIPALETGLRVYISRYFPESVTVTITEENPGENIRYTLNISVHVKHEGKAYELYDSLSVDPDRTIARLHEAMN